MELLGEPIYTVGDSEVRREDFVVYGRLLKEVLVAPTDVYASSFGHAYCMAEEVTYEIKHYIQGSGPPIIEFTQNLVDYCTPLAEEIGFEESILFFSKNKWRGIWSTGTARIFKDDGQRRIVLPADIERFSSLDNFKLLLSDYDEPVEIAFSRQLEAWKFSESLKELGVISERPSQNEEDKDFLLLNLHKYIDLEDLLRNNF